MFLSVFEFTTSKPLPLSFCVVLIRLLISNALDFEVTDAQKQRARKLLINWSRYPVKNLHDLDRRGACLTIHLRRGNIFHLQHCQFF